MTEVAGAGEVILIRHGQTEWSLSGRHTSRTDLPLTDVGRAQAAALAGALGRVGPAAVLCSPMQRARQTAQLAGLAQVGVDEDLAEWDYGQYEGLTTAQIYQLQPEWDLWRDGCPGGESPVQVGIRIDRLLERVRRLLAAGRPVILVGHGHSLRVVGARWCGLPVGDGARLLLETATLSRLGFEHGRPVLNTWNVSI